MFDVGIVLKGLDGVAELMGGAALLALDPAQIRWLISFVTHAELAEDPRDVLANALLHVGTTVTPEGLGTSIAFLLSHGAVKVFLVWNLLRGRVWAYPVTVAALSLFVAYQTFELSRHASATLAFLTVLDACIIALTWHEWRRAVR
jgi:uncharacterized membrane protein